jgi:hypothetical protein
MLVAVVGGIALNDLLKFAFALARPDIVVPLAPVFTTSFPSGHAGLSAITYAWIQMKGADVQLCRGERPVSSTLQRGDQLLGHLIDSAVWLFFG